MIICRDRQQIQIINVNKRKFPSLGVPENTQSSRRARINIISIAILSLAQKLLIDTFAKCMYN